MSEENITYVSEIKEADDNVVQTFQLVSSSLRGRVVRLGSVIDDIISKHNYSAPIDRLMAEVVTITVMLSSMLKYEGTFTLQIQGEGDISLIVCDVTSDGDIRGYASYSDDIKDDDFEKMFGKGYMAFTVEQGEHAERYQGIVELKSGGLVQSIQHYFNQSEQIGTAIKMAVSKIDGKWRAGGMMLQHMPEDGQNEEQGKGNIVEDNWRRAMILMESCSDEEILDPNLHSNILLRRLFHEEGVKVFEPYNVQVKCRCSNEKVERVLAMMSDEDKVETAKNGKINIKCEFCSKEYVFDIGE